MKELSIEEMSSLRGGNFDTGIIASIANTGIAVPVNVTAGSGNALFGSFAGNGGTRQNAQNVVGNIRAIQVVF